jgi:hypothetical protein
MGGSTTALASSLPSLTLDFQERIYAEGEGMKAGAASESAVALTPLMARPIVRKSHPRHRGLAQLGGASGSSGGEWGHGRG